MRLVVFHPDVQIGIVFKQAVVLQALKTQPVGSVGGVRDQFTQEDLLVAVQGVDHEVQQLLDFGFKTKRFFVRIYSHGIPVINQSVQLPNLGVTVENFKGRYTIPEDWGQSKCSDPKYERGWT